MVSERDAELVVEDEEEEEVEGRRCGVGCWEAVAVPVVVVGVGMYWEVDMADS